MSAKLLTWTGSTAATIAAKDVTATASQQALSNWMETQTRVMGFWLDRLLEDDADSELITMIHRHQSWMAMMQHRMSG